MCLVVGATGTGKSTLLRATNGHVPRFTGGTLSGRVQHRRPIDGRMAASRPGRRRRRRRSGSAAGFVTDTVEDELAYAMENIGVAPDAMRRRVEDVLDLLDLHTLRDRPLATLSGGQQQRVAIGSVLTANPRVLVLDEPTSALDPAAAEEVLAALTRLVHDLGITVSRSRAPSRTGRAVRRPHGARSRRRRAHPHRCARCGAGHVAGRTTSRPARSPGRLVAGAAVGPRRAPARARVFATGSTDVMPPTRSRERSASAWRR